MDKRVDKYDYDEKLIIIVMSNNKPEIMTKQQRYLEKTRIKLHKKCKRYLKEKRLQKMTHDQYMAKSEIGKNMKKRVC